MQRKQRCRRSGVEELRLRGEWVVLAILPLKLARAGPSIVEGRLRIVAGIVVADIEVVVPL